jgi:3-phosphoshikimate 1-carboxyvinyltransferase
MEIGLNQCGIKTNSTLNSLKIFGNPNITTSKKIKIYSKKDHRIAMSFFCLGQLVSEKIEIKNFETVNTSFSKFLSTMTKIGAKFEIKK